MIHLASTGDDGSRAMCGAMWAETTFWIPDVTCSECIAIQQSIRRTALCTCLYEVSGDDMSLDLDCPVHGSRTTANVIIEQTPNIIKELK